MRNRNYRTIKLTGRQRQFITGTILGGSSLIANGKVPYLSMRNKNLGWINFKSQELNCIATSNSVLCEATNRWHSVCHPCLQEFYDKFYKDGKRHLELPCLEGLHDVTLAIWFGDVGKYVNGHIILNTNIWGEKSIEVFLEFFDLVGWPASVIKQRGNYRMKLDEEGSLHFRRTIAPHLPLCLSH